MAYDLEKFSSGTLDKGISVRTMDFQAEIVLGIDSYNMSQGIQQGLGPRPGMATIPGQADNETIAGTRLPGLVASEGTPAAGFSARRKVLAIYPIRLPDPTNVANRVTTYAVLVTTVVSGTEYFDIVLTSTTNGSYESISANIYDGFGITSYSTATLLNYFAEAFVPVSGTRATALRSFLQYQGSNFVSSVAMAVTGSNIPMQWVMGEAKTDGDATHAPKVSYHKISSVNVLLGSASTIAGGVPSEYNLQNYTTTPRSMKVFTYLKTGAFNIAYSLNIPTPSSTTFIGDIFGEGVTNLDLSGITATKDTAGTTYTDSKMVLVNDPMCVSNASYKAVLVAAKQPVACIIQDAYRGENSGNNGKTNQWFDLTQNAFQPRVYNGLYTEEGIKTKTAFVDWPAFVRGTPLASTRGMNLGGANSGILRANTVYELTFSLYNKRLNFESNVGVPVKIQTGTNEFVSLQLYAGGSAVATPYSDMGARGPLAPPFVDYAFISTDNAGYQNFMNHLQYRFYYRQEGTFEWLPALFIDVPKFWFNPTFANIYACTGSLAGTVGGQPGGFNDYSALPKDLYTCVLQYKDRAWWFSDKAIVFSLRNNIFAYPARNSISAVGGEFKGGLVHNYPGQAEQSSRLIIFGTKETYVARFTGVRAQASVQVSPDSAGVFDIDASDLVIDPWTSVTAFSYRAAVVAEGILHWWGPQGVFRDDGVQTPTRISPDLEPNLFSLFDPSKTDEIFGNYNTQTKEIEWFFTPKTLAGDGEVLASIIYNTLSGNWTKGKYKEKLDWMQAVQVDSNVGTAGLREVVGVRASAASTTQRAYYFDQRNRSGDMAPTKDMVVKTVATPSAGVRRLTLAAGYDATNLASIVANDYIALQQVTSYSGLASASDIIAKVSVVNSGSGYIDILLPTGATLPTGTLTFDQYFPIWHATPTGTGLNGIAYNLATNYWFPNGVSGYYFWLYCYLLAKMDLWKTDLSLGWTLGYRTPTALATITDTIPFANNSDGNFQCYHPLRPGNDNHEGQGVKFTVSGNHIGHEWVLQYLEAHASPIKGDPLKRFEG